MKAPKVIVVATNKGGVGKTTISRFLSEKLALDGFKTLAIDLDPQASLSQRWIEMDQDQTDPDGVLPPIHPDEIEESVRSSSADPFNGLLPLPYTTPYENLTLVPAHGTPLRNAAKLEGSASEDELVGRLKLWLTSDDFLADKYDFVVIDTYPDKGPLLASALKAATHLIIPTTLEKQGVEAIPRMLAMYRRENRSRTPSEQLNLIGIIANMVDGRRALHSEYWDVLNDDSSIAPFVLKEQIGHRSAIADSDVPVGQRPSLISTTRNPEAKTRKMLEQAMNAIVEKVNNNG